MSKKRRPRQEQLDKPAYALGEEPGLKEGEQQRAKEARMEVADRLGKGAFDKLQALKQQMSESAAVASAKQGKKRSKSVQPPKDTDAEESFADLLDPKDEPDVSFEKLLQDSKLDWRSFK